MEQDNEWEIFAIENAPPKYIEGLVNPTSEEAEGEKEEGKEERRK